MKRTDAYLDLAGNRLDLAAVDADERRLIGSLRRRARTHADWCAFDSFWMKAVADFCAAHGITRRAGRHLVVYRIGQDLSNRLGLACGMIRPADYREELEELIRQHFSSRREFCKATGLAEDMLCHVLAGRKHLSLETLTDALARIGYTLHIMPAAERKRTG